MSYTTDVCFLINTFNRQESILNLVKSIRAIDRKIDIFIVDDGSDPPIKQYNNLFKFQNNIHVTWQGNKGKQYYWQTCNLLFSQVGKTNYKYYYMLPDDVTIPQTFLKDTQEVWNKINDPNKVALNLITDRIGLKCWTNFEPQYIEELKIWKTNWIDMAMMFNKKFFTYIIKLPHVQRDWDKNPMLGSGVGSYISRKIFSQGGTIYMNEKSFIDFQHSHGISRMNPKPGVRINSICYIGTNDFYHAFNGGHNNMLFKMENDTLIPLKESEGKLKAKDFKFLLKVDAYIDENGKIFY